MSILDKETTNAISSMVGGNKCASRGVAGTALGLGIAGTALALFGRDGHGLDLFGRGHHAEYERDAILAKENSDVLMLTNQIWGNTLRSQEHSFSDIVGINQKIFDNYVFTNKEIADAKAASNDRFFANYKETRDIKDQLVSEIGELKTEVAVLKAIAPYRDQLTAAAIAAAEQKDNFNLMTRTQRMIEGILTVPTTTATTGTGAGA